MSTKAPTVSLRENLFYNLAHVLPYYLRGIFRRKPFWYSLWCRFHPDPLGVQFIQALREKYRSEYLYLSMLGTKSLLVLDPDGIRHVLNHSPEIYAEAKLKRKGMSHFQPNALTISRGEEWKDRRRFNEAVLNAGQGVHEFGDAFLRIIQEELTAESQLARPELAWRDVESMFERIALQIIFGKGETNASLAHALTALMRESNRVFFLRKSSHFDGFYRRIHNYLTYPRDHSLALAANAAPATTRTKIENQVPHWLFAMKDTLAENVVPALALIVSHPDIERRVREEIERADLSSAHNIDQLSYLEACIQEAMRLWPSTPMLVRETVAADPLLAVEVPPGTQVLILNSFNHRDKKRDPFADAFLPDRWLTAQTPETANHFSNGPQVCAGKDLALWIAKSVLATLLRTASLTLQTPRLDPHKPVPYTFNHFTALFHRNPRRGSAIQ